MVSARATTEVSLRSIAHRVDSDGDVTYWHWSAMSEGNRYDAIIQQKIERGVVTHSFVPSAVRDQMITHPTIDIGWSADERLQRGTQVNDWIWPQLRQ